MSLRADPARARWLAIAGVGAGFLALLGVSWFAPTLARLLDLVTPFFGLIALGFICCKLFDLPRIAVGWLNVFVGYVALPSLFFALLSHVPVEQLAASGGFVLGVAAATACAFGCAFTLGLAFSKGDVATATILGAIGSYGNIGYMGPALTLAALGPQAAAPTAFVFVADTVFLCAIIPLGMALAQEQGRGRGQGWTVAKKAILSVVRHPFNIAIALALASATLHLRPPPAIDRMIVSLSGAAAPCALFLLGAVVAYQPARAPSPEAPPVLAVKLLLHPVLAWGFMFLVGAPPTWAAVAVLMASLPPALNVFVIAEQYRVYVAGASNLVLLGALASVVTVTAALWLIVGIGAP